MTVVAVTDRFIILIDDDGHRFRVATPQRAPLSKGDTVTLEDVIALAEHQ